MTAFPFLFYQMNLGTASGRDEDKIAKSNLTVKEYEDVPYFEEGRLIPMP